MAPLGAPKALAPQALARPMDPMGAISAARAPPSAMFSEAVLSARLARALDALLAMKRADEAQIARGPRAGALLAMKLADEAQIARGPRGLRAAIFTTPRARAFMRRTASRCTSSAAA